MNSILLSTINVHNSWNEFFEQEIIQEELAHIEKCISTVQYTPQQNLVLRFATLDLLSLSVLVMGQDPYPQNNVATGRAFEVNGVTSWNDKTINTSIKNIIKLLHKSYIANASVNRSRSVKKVREDIQNGVFPILPPNQIFDYWEQNGALWLNTAFTCEVNKPDSHTQLWKPFFNNLLSYIARKRPDMKFFLWGNKAQAYVKPLKALHIPDENLYQSTHPRHHSDEGGFAKKSHFLMNPCFKETISIWI